LSNHSGTLLPDPCLTDEIQYKGQYINASATELKQQMPELSGRRRSLAEFEKMRTFPRSGKPQK
jgi:hypothetical protein